MGKLSEISLSEKEDFYGNVNVKDFTDVYYMHTRRASKDFEIKNLEEYYDLYVQSIFEKYLKLFENFRKINFTLVVLLLLQD